MSSFSAGATTAMRSSTCHGCTAGIAGAGTVAGTPCGGSATLYSWTVVAHQVHPAYPTPYTVVLVDLDEAPGTHLVGQVPGSPELHAGMPMELWFEELGAVDGRPVVVPNWRPVLSASDEPTGRLKQTG